MQPLWSPKDFPCAASSLRFARWLGRQGSSHYRWDVCLPHFGPHTPTTQSPIVSHCGKHVTRVAENFGQLHSSSGQGSLGGRVNHFGLMSRHVWLPRVPVHIPTKPSLPHSVHRGAGCPPTAAPLFSRTRRYLPPSVPSSFLSRPVAARLGGPGMGRGAKKRQEKGGPAGIAGSCLCCL